MPTAHECNQRRYRAAIAAAEQALDRQPFADLTPPSGADPIAWAAWAEIAARLAAAWAEARP